jgi:dienelactone hydrolase
MADPERGERTITPTIIGARMHGGKDQSARCGGRAADFRLVSAASEQQEHAMAEKKVPYQVDGRPFEGMIVYDDAVKTKRPVIFMQPDWKGVCADTVGMARIVAGTDYVVLMADMFGRGYGDKPKTQDELRAGMLAVHKNLPFTIACGGTAYDTLLAEAGKLGVADSAKTVAIGYCAGGGYVLEQARAGADFKAVVVFHVTNPNPVVPGTPCNIKGRVLAIHGRADPITPKPMMDAFEEEMSAAKVDWQVMMFGPPAVHSFCDPTANAAATCYDEKLCRKSYRLMRDFFAETL